MNRVSLIARAACSAAALAAALSAASSGLARETPLSIRNSFRIGTSGVACTAQNATADKRLSGMFDRGYMLTCRDAAGAVGSLIAVRRDIDISEVPSVIASNADDCRPVETAQVDTLGNVAKLTCRDPRSNLDYRRYVYDQGNVSYFVEGLAGYDPVLKLALATVVADRTVPGEIRVATTEVSDAAAFARVQAGLLDAQDAKAEAYFRNNGGRYAESAEFFETLSQRSERQSFEKTEALANQALQQSNLGDFTGAERLFAEAEMSLARRDVVNQRLLRNYRALNLLNQRDPQGAIFMLDSPMLSVAEAEEASDLAEGVISLPLADQINRENVALQRIGGVQSGVTVQERVTVLDAQARALRGTALRQQGDLVKADELLMDAIEALRGVRSGHLHSASFMIADIQMERALIAEARGDYGSASAAYDAAVRVAADAFPNSPILLSTQARKAAFLARTGQEEDAKALFASVVARSSNVPDSGPPLRELLGPYFAMLASDGTRESAADMFVAAQVLQRPGVAQTQAVLARGLSEGNDDAAAMFRLSVARTRAIGRVQADIARLSSLAEPSDVQREALIASRQTLEQLQREQTELIAKLGNFPRYRVLSPPRVTLEELQSALSPQEAYWKLMQVGDEVFALFISRAEAVAYSPEANVLALEDEVRAIRDSIVVFENGQQLTYPFDVVRARELYKTLFAPVSQSVLAAKHIIVEPDGPMLQLPPYLLVTEDEGVDAYMQRTEAIDADMYDFTGVAWLGRGREMSIAVSPRGFLDIRNLGPSQADQPYLGLGRNKMPSERPIAAVASECDWPLATWRDPIEADELYFAQSKFGDGRVIVDGEFSDSNLLSLPQMDEYRVLHFATHGLVTAPRPGCPAKPALVTSFGDSGSDGLLNFREIFDLKLDADVVILSACDTAGAATAAASRDAGITTGGNYALDGLVRAFVGAGARSVVASHWPVPDDYDATKRLIGGLIDAQAGEALSASLARAQEGLMDDPLTSHPFYWSAFIVVGDGAKSLIPQAQSGG